MLRHLIEVKPWRHSLGLKLSCRTFAASGGGGGDSTSVKVFDRAAKRRHRDAAAAADWEGDFDYLREHIASALVDRIEVGRSEALFTQCPRRTHAHLRSSEHRSPEVT